MTGQLVMSCAHLLEQRRRIYYSTDHVVCKWQFIGIRWYAREESNLRLQIRSLVLYPLSYGRMTSFVILAENNLRCKVLTAEQLAIAINYHSN